LIPVIVVVGPVSCL